MHVLQDQEATQVIDLGCRFFWIVSGCGVQAEPDLIAAVDA